MPRDDNVVFITPSHFFLHFKHTVRVDGLIALPLPVSNIVVSLLLCSQFDISTSTLARVLRLQVCDFTFMTSTLGGDEGVFKFGF